MCVCTRLKNGEVSTSPFINALFSIKMRPWKITVLFGRTGYYGWRREIGDFIANAENHRRKSVRCMHYAAGNRCNASFLVIVILFDNCFIESCFCVCVLNRVFTLKWLELKGALLSTSYGTKLQSPHSFQIYHLKVVCAAHTAKC